MGDVLDGVLNELHDDVPAAVAAAAKSLAKALDSADTSPRDLASLSRELRLTMDLVRSAGKAKDDGVDEVAAKRAERRRRLAASTS